MSVLLIKKIAKDLVQSHYELVMDGIPGHQGIRGYEEPNELARAKLAETPPSIDHDYPMVGWEQPSDDPNCVEEWLKEERGKCPTGLLSGDGYPRYLTSLKLAKACL